MKKIIILIALFVSLAAQAYEPLIREDRIWEYWSAYGNTVTDDHNSELYTLKFDGTREVFGKTYHRLMLHDVNSWSYRYPDGYINPKYQLVDEELYLLREEDCKVYMLYSTYYNPIYNSKDILIYNSETKEVESVEVSEDYEVVIYDFSGEKEGDEFTAAGNYIFCEDEIPMLTIVPYTITELEKGTESPFTRFILRNESIPEEYFGENSNIVSVVEGIGNVGEGGFLFPVTEARLYYNGTRAFSHSEEFNNLYDLEGNVIYAGAGIKNPLAGVESVQSDANVDSQMYDLFGRVITDPAPGTVYIRNGRKEIAR